MARVDVRDAVKAFARRTVVDGVSLRVDDGEILTILGPSGAGKTTLLRLIAGLERLDAGAVRLGTRDVTREPARCRGVGYVFQDFALFPHRSVRANITFGMRLRGVAARERLTALAERLQLGTLLDRLPARLSGGERQRVAIARALATDPAVLLFDEPFASLDAPLRARLRAEIAALRGPDAVATLFVTHDQDEALALGDRVALLEAGRIVALAPPAELLARPPTLFAAQFVGRPPAVVFHGHVRDGTFVADHGLLEAAGVDAATATLAVRADAVRLVDPPAATVAGTVRFIETIGARRYATVAFGGALVTASADTTARAGQTAGVRVDLRGAWRYDARGNLIG